MLSASDLDETDEPVSDTFGTNEPVHVMYVLEMVKLARLRGLRTLAYLLEAYGPNAYTTVGKIMTNQFTPGNSHHDQDERSSLFDALSRWRSELPENLRECGSESSRPGILWTYLLHLYYK